MEQVGTTSLRNDACEKLTIASLDIYGSVRHRPGQCFDVTSLLQAPNNKITFKNARKKNREQKNTKKYKRCLRRAQQLLEKKRLAKNGVVV